MVTLVTLGFGLAALLLGAARASLLAFGETVEGVITQVETGAPETEIRRQRRGADRATGYFLIDVAVTYRFAVLPTPTEALRRGSDAPLHTDVPGRDTVRWRTRDPQAEPLRPGTPLRIVYLRTFPAWNRAHQPGSLKAEAITWAGCGLALVVIAFFIRPTAIRQPKRPA